MSRLRVGVIFGGRSVEHEVSIVSARSIIASLDQDKYQIIPIGITKQGAWYTGANVLEVFSQQKGQGLRVFLPADPTLRRLIPAGQVSSLDREVTDLLESLDVVFPILHGTFGEDGTIQGLLELADIPYVGAGVLGSSLAMDKIMQKLICDRQGLPVVDFLWFRSSDWHNKPDDDETPLLHGQLSHLSQKDFVSTIIDKLGLPVFVKPANLGSSVGISKAHSAEELETAIHYAVQYDRKVIIEKAVSPAREIEVSVLGNERPRASVAGEVIPSNEFYDYDAKYVDGKSDLKIPAELPDDLHQAIRAAAVKSVLATDVEGMARVDFLLDVKTDEYFVSEINTIPGFTQISMYPKLWQATGLSYSALLDELIRLSIERHEQKKKLQTSYQPKKDWYR